MLKIGMESKRIRIFRFYTIKRRIFDQKVTIIGGILTKEIEGNCEKIYFSYLRKGLPVNIQIILE